MMEQAVVARSMELAAREEGSKSVDILGRQGFVDQIKNIIMSLSATKQSRAFAIDGKWGVGKTFVLNLLEQQLRDYRDGEEYLVFHYNAWQSDYYEEPLTAITTSIIDSIDETKLFSSRLRKNIKDNLIVAKDTLIEILRKFAVSCVNSKFGIDTDELTKEIRKAKESVTSTKKEGPDYDPYYAYPDVLKSTRQCLGKLSENQSIVIVVDELDRCLPAYAIKVLERLHHLFAEVSNVILVIAIDKEQLESTIKQIFGNEINVSGYLKKFIDFDVKLDAGKTISGCREKYKRYLDMFDESLFNIGIDLDEFFSAIFSDIEIRTEERLIDCAEVMHRMLFGDKVMDYSFMCCELMLSILMYRNSATHLYFDIDNDGGLFVARTNIHVPAGDGVPNEIADYFKSNWNVKSITHLLPSGNLQLHDPINVLNLIVWYFQEIKHDSKRTIELPDGYDTQRGYVDDLKAFISLLEQMGLKDESANK